MLMIPVYFPLGGCVDNVINSQTNHQLTSIILQLYTLLYTKL